MATIGLDCGVVLEKAGGLRWQRRFLGRLALLALVGTGISRPGHLLTWFTASILTLAELPPAIPPGGKVKTLGDDATK